jgi:hypothetical protein
VQRFDADGHRQPGRVGSGVIPELKRSQDLTLAGRADWRDAEAQLNDALFACLLRYVRRYPYVLIAPLMLQLSDPQSGQVRRLAEGDLADMGDTQLGNLIRACFRPGAINLQHYQADRGGYPYWHCELYPRDAQCEPLHRHLLWTLYLNDGFADGETEFLYQQRRIKPQVGALLLAPTAFTHTHRGNQPRGGDKYIATSWVLFQRAETLFRER